MSGKFSQGNKLAPLTLLCQRDFSWAQNRTAPMTPPSRKAPENSLPSERHGDKQEEGSGNEDCCC